MDWAEIGTISTLFSCLAAHAAVLHLDGIARRPLPKKISGVFASLRAVDDPLLAGLPARARDAAFAPQRTARKAIWWPKDYRILSRLTDGSVDVFARERPKPLCLLAGPSRIWRRDAGPGISARHRPLSQRRRAAPRDSGKLFRPRHRKRLAGAGRRARPGSRIIARSCSAPCRCNPGAAIRSDCLPTGSPPSRRKNPAAARPGPRKSA